MKGNDKVIEHLNAALCAELTAINLYFIHSRMRKAAGYHKLAAKSYEESIEEMRHAQTLIDRILFLEGVPNMQKYKPIRVAPDIKGQMEVELEEELSAVKDYNAAIRDCREAGDNGSGEIFERLLADEEGHVDWLEEQLGLMKEIGMQNYLLLQVGEEAGE